MKIVFFGTPDYVIPILESLNKNFREKNGSSSVVVVVTQKPQLAGREHKMSYSPVDTWAFKKKIPVYSEPEKLIEDKVKADIGILASFGQIISKPVLDYFPYGILNIHPSNLTILRGSSPVQATILTGSEPTVSIIKLDKKLDHGPIITQFKDELMPDDTTVTLRNRLFDRSAEVLVGLIPAYTQGKIKIHEQDHTKATFTRELRKEDGFIPAEYLSAALKGKSLQGTWKIPFIYTKVKGSKLNTQSEIIREPLDLKLSALSIYSFIRAMEPWPGSWTEVQLTKELKNGETKKRIKILNAHLEPISVDSRESLKVNNKQRKVVVMQIRDNSHEGMKLVIDMVQIESKEPVSWKQFCQGYSEASF